MVAFHDYHLFPFFHRLSDRHLYPCVHAPHRPDEEHAPTDLSHLPEDLVEIEPEAADDGARPVMEAEDAPPASDESA